MAKFQGLRTTIYKVTDIEEAKTWYSQMFETIPYFDQPFYVGFNIGGYELGLQPAVKKADVQPDNVVSYWGVDDIQSAYNFMINSGAEPYEKPENVGGDIEVATVIDPWGNVIGLICNPGFKIVGND